ncbi:MAG: cupredoxin family copper-binding protein [Pyrinomonadaceae bacterium]
MNIGIGLCALLFVCGLTIVAQSDKKTMADKRASAEVTITNFQFTPKELHVKVGATVTWTNKEGVHTIASDDGKTFSSQTLNAGDKFTYKFKKAGKYPYYCTFHGSSGGHEMAGIVVVEK